MAERRLVLSEDELTRVVAEHFGVPETDVDICRTEEDDTGKEYVEVSILLDIVFDYNRYRNVKL